MRDSIRHRRGPAVPLCIASAMSAAFLAAVLAAGCAATAHTRAPATLPPVADHPRIALLPLENLSGQADAGVITTRIFFVRLVGTGCCDVVETGLVEAALDSMGVRSTGSLTRDQLAELGRRLGAPYVLLGSVLESGTVRTPEGDVPSISVTLKLLETETGRVAWASGGFRTGDDREKAFGLGRERNRERLTASLAAELLEPFRDAAVEALERQKEARK